MTICESELGAVPMRDYNVLLNRSIVQWIGEEMAFSEGEEGASIIWQHSSIPFMQFIRLDALLDDGHVMTFLSQLDDGSGWFGIYTPSQPIGLLETEVYQPGSIYRRRDISEMPTGKISGTKDESDGSGNVLEIFLAIGNSIIRIISGEIYEKNDGSFWMASVDESLLVQVTNSA